MIDTGIRTTHTELGGRATADFSAIDDGYGATGCHWHGTHVAATIAGSSVGVAKDTHVHSVRVLDCNASGSVSGLIAGIDWVLQNAQLPAVINMSIVGGYSQAENDAIQNAIDNGITVITAAGNNSGDACGFSPSSAPNAITVGATLQTDELAPFSNYGACVDILAPGGSVYSASNGTDRSMLWADGTSMASPHVAGVAAQYLQTHPTASPAEVAAALLQDATAGTITGLDATTANLMVRSR